MPSTTFYANKGARIAKNGSLEQGAGSSDYLPVGLYSGYLYRALLGFSYSFSGWTGITAATLNLKTSGQFYVAFSSDPDIHIRRLTESWSEGSSSGLSTSNAVTYANQPSSTSSGEATMDVSTSENDWVSVDITSIMQGALSAGVFHGLKLYAVDETSGEVTEFYSDDTTSKPYISVTYTTNDAPNAPTSLSPTGDSVVHTLTPTLSGTFSDPDAGDTLSGVEIDVYVDDLSGGKWFSGMLSASGTTFSKTYAGLGLVGGNYYQWRARTKDASGAVGPWSGWQRFRPNSVPNAPSISINGTASDQTTLTPTFNITHEDADNDKNLTGYHIKVVRDSDGTMMWDTGDVSATSTRTKSVAYAGTALDWQTDYYIYARTKDALGAWGPYSGIYDFSTHTTSVPTSLNPTGSAVASSLTPTFSGSRGSSNDSLTSARIRVYAADGVTLIWDSGTFTSGVTSTGFSKVYAGPALSAATTYKWQAQVTSSVGGTSAYSSAQTFIAPDTNTPTIVAPLGPGITDLTPDIQFSRAATFVKHDITVYSDDGTTVLWSSISASSYAATTSKTVTYAGTALAFGHEYFVKVRVSADGSTWSPYAGPVSFQTGIAGLPTLDAPVEGSWETTTTPTFEGTTADSEVIDTYRIKVYDETGATLIWDSGNISGSGTTFSEAYSGSTALVKGTAYVWTASYVKDDGSPGGDAPAQSFHVNADPRSPGDLSPSAGEVVDSITPTFSATYLDDDIAGYGDTPTELEVEVYRVSDSVLMHSLSDTTDLVAGQNSIVRAAEGTALSLEVEYMYRARYTDSQGAVGAWSPYVTFKPSEPPVVTITSPGATLAAPGFPVTWTYSSPGSKVQQAYRVRVIRSSDEVAVYDTGIVISADTSWDMPSGYLLNTETYDVEVTVYDTDDLTDVDTVNTLADWTPPAAPASFSVTTDPATSTVIASWEVSALPDEEFSFYEVYRKESTDETFTPYEAITNKATTSYTDYLAANQTNYDYKVTQFTVVPGDVDLESDSPEVQSALIDLDEWFVIGADGSAEHSFALPVAGEAHQKPIQQEVFEPLGSNRKKTARGNVLGHEGTLDMQFEKDERELAKERLNYLAENAGPHILKSPFGDVWRVEFSGPQFKYTPGGHLSVTMAWIEVA